MTAQDLILSGVFTVLFAVVFGSIEIIKRKFGVSSEIMRRVAHMASGGLLLLDYYLLTPFVFVLLVVGGGVLFFVLSSRAVFTSINNVARRSIGQYVLTAAYLITYAISQGNESVFIASVLIVTFADAFAGLYGTLMQATKRTVIGSLIFFVVAVVILFATGVVGLPALLFIAAALALVERFTPLGLDNLSVPVVSALLLLAFQS